MSEDRENVSQLPKPEIGVLYYRKPVVLSSKADSFLCKKRVEFIGPYSVFVISEKFSAGYHWVTYANATQFQDSIVRCATLAHFWRQFATTPNELDEEHCERVVLG